MSSAPDDTLLHAWLDGELLPERAEIEAWLQVHPDDEARLRLWTADRDALRVRFDAVLGEPVPQALAQGVWRKAPLTLASPGFRFGSGWGRWAAAFAVFLLGGSAGAGLMWRLQPQGADPSARTGEPAWVHRAAVAHAVYVPEVRHAVEVKAQEEHLSRWLTKRLEVPVKLFDLRAQSFELVGGRLLPDAAGPSAQLMYQAVQPAGAAADARPVRVTVYLRKPDSATPTAFRYEQQRALGLFYWVEGRSAEGGPCGYALVGELPRQRLLALAEAIFKQSPGDPS
ncbi:MAG: anti-sigma factor [Rhizobacter sp.]|nr:anti-sigma factor [Rhizobacter sp.]